MKGPAVWLNCTSFRIFLLIKEGLSLADRRLQYSFWGPWTLKTNAKPLSDTLQEIVDAGVVRVIIQIRGKLSDINRGGRGQL